MGRFSHLATQPQPGPRQMIKWKLLGKGEKSAAPDVPPKVRAHDRALVDSGRASLTWIGHASFLLVIGGLRVLIDPVLTPHMGPAGVGLTKRLQPPGIPIEDLAEIDVVLLTHNHRDHFDEPTLKAILAAHTIGPSRRGKKTAPIRPRFIVPLGDGALVSKLGAGAIDELDWWGSVKIGHVTITLVPSRHWSMRVPWDRDDSLWGGYVIQGPEGAAYHSGDTGFFDGFAEIGRRFGPIDWAMLPVGAYAPRWFMEPQHMNPEEAALAAEMVSAHAFVAMHWGTYRLTDEPLGEGPERARAAFCKTPEDAGRLWVLDIGETRRL